MTDLLRPFRQGIHRLLNKLFQDTTLATRITYRLYVGIEKNSSDEMVAVWNEFTLNALPMNLRLSPVAVQSGGSIEGRTSGFMFRPSDLPSPITVDDLTVNDEIAVDGKVFQIKDVNRTIPLVVAVTVDGG